MGWAGSLLRSSERSDEAEAALHRAADLSHDTRLIQEWQELRTHMGLSSPASANRVCTETFFTCPRKGAALRHVLLVRDWPFLAAMSRKCEARGTPARCI